jgi:hypothetical protein
MLTRIVIEAGAGCKRKNGNFKQFQTDGRGEFGIDLNPNEITFSRADPETFRKRQSPPPPPPPSPAEPAPSLPNRSCDRRRSLISQAKCGIWSGRANDQLFETKKGEAMRRILLALAAVALAGSTVAAPAPAHAQRGVAAGVAAGLIGGAIVGGAIASQNRYYGPGYYYGPGPGYYVADPGYYDTPCVWQRQRFWDGYGWRVRNVRVCY